MKIWLGLNKKYAITLVDGSMVTGITKFWRTPNTADYLPIVLAVDGKEVQIGIDNVSAVREIT